ncbi:MAG TPA: hypothetical protein DCK95_10060 [Anaerolineaceae bacterium]|uniref:Carbohydrate-binding domain-containing protein n=1 Tax=Anaerolinea thermophila TaxID=167964 RepID=A0A101FY17_9CHLR|nr:MAG: hypothetical protein XD73_0644 [Anaerolinea thermophila]HAF62653.1 hypothetical protein [Anaerolineaceae bacterium]
MSKKLIAVFTMLFLLVSCNFPISQQAEPTSLFNQPAQTLTALFASYPTQTPGESQQVLPSATTAPDSSTPVSPTLEETSTIQQMERSAQHVMAKYLSKKPVMDGDWGDWKQNTIAYPAYYIVYGLKDWDDDSDLEASFILGWDESFLYVGVKVKDEEYVQNASGELLFKGDSVELLIDTDLQGDFSSTSLNGDDFQLGFSPGKGTTSGKREAYLWFPAERQGSISDQVDVVSISTLGLYRVEIRIPWSVLQITPHEGMRLGFVFSVSDNDDATAIVQQSLVSNIASRKLTDPTTWGELILD